VERAKETVVGVPAETRSANADGTTRYMRPRPGAARMYPETDIPPSRITSELLDKIRDGLPESAEKKKKRLMSQYSLNEKLANQVIDSEYSTLFEVVVKESEVAPTTVAAFLTETVKALKREGISVEKVSDVQIRAIFQGIASGLMAKEAFADVFSWLSKHDDKTVQDAIDGLGLRMLTNAEVEKLVERVIAENEQAVTKMGSKVFGLIMGLVMKEARGRADPSVVGKLLKERLR